jgi:hypothetical protein
LNVRNYLLNLFDFLLNQYLFHIFLNFLYFSDILDNRHYFLSYLRLRNYLLNNLLFGDNPLNNCLHGDWDLEWYDDLPVDWNCPDALMDQWHNLFDLQLNWPFLDDCDGDLSHYLLGDHSLFVLRHLN